MRARGVRCDPEAHASGDRGAAPAQELRGDGRGRRCLLRRAGGRDLRDPRPQRRGQDHDRRVHRGPAGGGPGRDQRARARSPAGPRRADPAARRPAAGQRAARPAAGRRGPGALQLLLPEPADWRTLMDVLGLAGKSRTRFAKLSGGQKQRLSIALALVGSPQVAVLDELTTGLDPQARRDTWELIEGVRDRGVTIVLVTHFMEEAERLCDRVALIDAGRVVADRHPGRAGRAGPGRAADPVPPVRPARRRAADQPARRDQRRPQGRCRGGHRQRQRAERGHLRAGPQPDRGPAATRGAGQPGGRVRRADRPARRRTKPTGTGEPSCQSRCRR